ncbi:alpha/beta hydrolase [Pedobacter sp. SD-b]|uniref:Alpha/beta hydrolase n=1 Tax=Pedobacter segetis TaxID=2793069 RepID=A0ABS1BLI2_9SPHI|nr:alpha/beta hydrolase [Pedobacter segetis]MBK0383601.1 alpha/beta hydrolase [Pedobacter segetis]
MMNKYKIGCLIIACCLSSRSFSQVAFPLYDGAVPNSKNLAEANLNNDKKGYAPTITAFVNKTTQKNRAAIIFLPGGGYNSVAYNGGGNGIAEYFQNLGLAAFILKYRVPTDDFMLDKKTGPIQDLQQAIIWVKEHAEEYGIDTAKVGILGSSAGGHLAAMGSTQFATNFVENPKHYSLRPAFSVLLYPVISFADSIMHKGSRDNLLGKNPSPALIKQYSNELNVTSDTPPTLLIQAQDDPTVPVANSIVYFEALTKNKVEAEMHIYPHGGHGFGAYNKTTPDNWLERCKNWMIMNGWLEGAK